MSSESIDPIRLPLLELIGSGGLPRTEPHTCSYLPDRLSSSEGFSIGAMQGGTYHDLMDLGFRRSGRIFYRPRCQGCAACVPMRVPVEAFAPSKSQRRALRRNADIAMRIGAPELTDEKVALYQRYLRHQHPHSPQSGDAEGLRDFLYDSVVQTIEVNYLKNDRLLAVSILDVCDRSVSTVYHFFDPLESRRSLGVFSVLAEIDLTRHWNVPHYYMGFWVQGSKAMQYKANYRPHELLLEGRWRRQQ
jgi:arginine-tRNA-protein transferase